jgi:hypothetical protein
MLGWFRWLLFGKEFLKEINESSLALSSVQFERDHLKVKIAKQEAEIEFLKDRVEFFKTLIDGLQIEKKELLEDLLIASGVKMSKQQEELLKAQQREGEDRPNYGGQTRNLSHDLTQQSIQESSSDRDRRAIAILEQLEKEAGVNTGGLKDV